MHTPTEVETAESVASFSAFLTFPDLKQASFSYATCYQRETVPVDEL